MMRYDVTLKNEINNNSRTYLADSFLVDENRVLSIKSTECGDVVVNIDIDEKIIITVLIINEGFQYLENSLS